MRRFLTVAFIVVVALGAAAWFWSGGRSIAESEIAGLTGDAIRGEAVYWAAGCASCHTAPDSDDRLTLPGGHRFPSDFGTFIAPNISTDTTHGIGGWTTQEFATALVNGVSPDGRHYYPAFPYGAYANMEMQDIVDLKAFMDTLPASDVPNQPHEVSFPFTIRRGLALWKAVRSPKGLWLRPCNRPRLNADGIWLRPWHIAATATHRAMPSVDWKPNVGWPVRPTLLGEAQYLVCRLPNWIGPSKTWPITLKPGSPLISIALVA